MRVVFIFVGLFATMGILAWLTRKFTPNADTKVPTNRDYFKPGRWDHYNT